MCFFKRNPKPIGKAFDYAGYRLAFSEDFTTPINWEKWTPNYPGEQDKKELTRWIKECVEQHEDGVHLIARKGNGENECGQLCTWKFLETLYGYTTFTAKMPPNGFLYFAALWGYNKRGHQPEIDVVELAGKKSDELWFTHHYVIPPDILTDHAVGINLVYPKTDFSKGFHEYSIEWTPDRVTWYVDRLPYFEITENIPNVPIFWVMGIQAGGPEGMFKHLFTDQESGGRMVIRKFEIFTKSN